MAKFAFSRDRIQRWMGEAFWVGFGLITAILALFVGTRFLTKLLSTSEYGRLALAVSLATLAVQIFGDPVGKTAVRFYAFWCETGKPYGFLQNIGRSLVYAAGGIVLVCIASVITGYWLDGRPDFYFIMVTGIFALLLILNRIALALADAARKRRFRGIIQGMFEALRFLFAIGFIIWLSAPVAENVLGGFAVAGVLVVIAHGVFLRKLFSAVPRNTSGPEERRFLLENVSMQSFQSPLILSNAFIWLVMMAERWILKFYGSPGDVGGYAAVYQLAFVPMLFIGNFLILFLEPILYQMIRPDGKTAASLQAFRINRYAALGILVFSLILFTWLLFSYPMVGHLFLGIEFRPYSWVFPWLVLAGGCFASAQQLLLKLSCEMQTGLLAVLWGGLAIFAVTAYMIGAHYWQLKGIIWAMVAVNVLWVVFLLVFSERKRTAV